MGPLNIGITCFPTFGGSGVIATAQTGIPNSVDAGKMISGYPAIDNRDWLKSSAVFRRLPELKKANLAPVKPWSAAVLVLVCESGWNRPA